ncbi:MAG: hypothetical protein AB199_01315 [Parcubacteria bacterium C7867-004]|nr:MAG: hypothetical protein AB199_01315 [Parcubacteria bacterium C7867-004]
MMKKWLIHSGVVALIACGIAAYLYLQPQAMDTEFLQHAEELMDAKIVAAPLRKEVYTRTEGNATLTITYLDTTRVSVHGFATWTGTGVGQVNTGDFDATTTIANGKVHITSSDEFEGGYGDSCAIDISFSEDRASVEVSDQGCIWGLNVSFTGTYRASGKGDIKEILSSQGATFPVDTGVTYESLGTVHLGSVSYDGIYYSWSDPHPVGQAVHGSQRLIILKGGTEYLGNYSIDSRPEGITDQRIVFNLPASEGNEIIFTEAGPPKTVLLDGENRTLQK